MTGVEEPEFLDALGKPLKCGFVPLAGVVGCRMEAINRYHHDPKIRWRLAKCGRWGMFGARHNRREKEERPLASVSIGKRAGHG
jgi:hypothetical protein